MTTFVPHLEMVIDDVFLAHLHIVRQPLSADRLSPAAFVQAELGVDQLALVLQQPLDPVVGPAAFLVGRERNDDVAIGPEPFALVPDQVRDPHRRLRLVVAGSAAVEVAVALGQRERIHAPVFAFRFHDIGMRQQKNRTATAGAVIPNDQVGFRRDRAADEDVGIRKAGLLETARRSFGHRCRGAGRVAGFDLHHFLIDRTRELLLRLGRHRLREERGTRQNRACGDSVHEHDDSGLFFHIVLTCRLYTTRSPSSIIRWRRPAREKLVDGVVSGREGNTCRGSAGGEQRFDGARRAAIHPVRINARLDGEHERGAPLLVRHIYRRTASEQQVHDIRPCAPRGDV